MLVRSNFLGDIERFLGLKGATWIYSMWRGYFDKDESLRNLRSYLQGKGVRVEYLHTSGHATLAELIDLVNALGPRMIIPIHTSYPEKFKDHFSNVKLLKDGEVFEIP